jgi:hypothetical protein
MYYWWFGHGVKIQLEREAKETRAKLKAGEKLDKETENAYRNYLDKAVDEGWISEDTAKKHRNKISGGKRKSLEKRSLKKRKLK